MRERGVVRQFGSVSGKGVGERSLPAASASAAAAVEAEEGAAAEEPGAPEGGHDPLAADASAAPAGDEASPEIAAAPRKKKRKCKATPAVADDSAGAAVPMRQSPRLEPARPTPTARPAPSTTPSVVSSEGGLPTDVKVMIGGAHPSQQRGRRRTAAPSSACGSAYDPKTPHQQIGTASQRTSRRGPSCKLGARMVSGELRERRRRRNVDV